MDPAATRRVLIVDDDPGIRRLLVTFMRSKGFQLSEARNGRDALAAMRTGEIDVVVMDLMMPEVSGWDVLRQRESDPSLWRIAVIIVTATDVARVEAEVEGKHVSAVIGKPFDLDALLTSVTECLDRRVIDTPAAA